MNKKLLITILCIIVALTLLIFLGIFAKKYYETAEFQPGIDKIATQNIAIIYHPYNDGIKQVADIIKSKVGGDVYILEPFSDYPTSADLRKDRIKKEQLHPEKVSLKDNKFNIKKYNIVFIGVPVIDGMMSPVMMRFVLDHEKLLNKNIVTIPFVFLTNNDSPKETYKFLYRYTMFSAQKSGYTTTFLDKQANDMYITSWLEQINFHRYELKKPSKDKINAYEQAKKSEKETAKKAKEFRSLINRNNRENTGEKPPVKPAYRGF